MAGRAPGGLHRAALRIFEGLADSYEKVVDFATLYQDRYWKRWAVSRVRLGRGALVLDLGCGTLLLEERVATLGWRFVGIDLTEEMLRVGLAKGLGNVSVLEGDAEFLPFQHGTFDGVVCCYVPKYVRISGLARELSRVCRLGGTVVLYDFARPRGLFAPLLGLYIDGGLRVAGYFLRLAGSKAAATFSDLPGIIRMTTWDGEIVAAMEAEGFETVEAGPFTGGAAFGYCGRKRDRP